MWIRSQDREILSNCVEFYLQELKESYAVLGVAKNRSGHFIATYSTKEKALKVLDMIQKELDSYYYSTAMIIFQMPLDIEVVDDE